MFAAGGSVQSAVLQTWAALDEGFTLARGEAGLQLGGSRSSCYSWVMKEGIERSHLLQVYKSLFHCCSLKLLVCTLMLCQLINTGCSRCPSVLVSASCKLGDAHWWVESHNDSSLNYCFRITALGTVTTRTGWGKTRYPWWWSWGLARATAGCFLKLLGECYFPFLNAAQHKRGKTLFSGLLDCWVLLLPSSMIREAFLSLAPAVLYMNGTEIKRYDVCSCEHICVCSWSCIVLGMSVMIL